MAVKFLSNFGKETNYPLCYFMVMAMIILFNYQISYFSKEYQVIAVDTRGHGRSTNTQSQLTFPLLAEDLAGIIQQEHLTKLIYWALVTEQILPWFYPFIS